MRRRAGEEGGEGGVGRKKHPQCFSLLAPWGKAWSHQPAAELEVQGQTDGGSICQ